MKKTGRVILMIAAILMMSTLGLVGVIANLGWIYFLGVACAAALFVSQTWSARNRAREACFRAFLNNHYVGMVLFVGIALATAQR